MTKEFAKKNGICFVILSQVNRQGNEKPTLAHLKSSGKIEEVPICGESDRWFKAGKWAVQEEGKDKATRLLETKEQAEAYLKGMPEKARLKATIIERKGIDTKCANYCSVARFCSYGKQYFTS